MAPTSDRGTGSGSSRPTERPAERPLYFPALPPGRGRGAGWTGPPSSSGLGFRPFKAATRVRIPLGAHNRIAHAPVEESGRPHRPVKAEIAGSKPVGRADLPAVSLRRPQVVRLCRRSRGGGRDAEAFDRPPRRVAELFGVSKQRAHQIADEPGFPAPAERDGHGARGIGEGAEAWARASRAPSPRR
jgi:hypothetical protein